MHLRSIAEEELTAALFAGFDRTQVVTDCLRRVEGRWVPRPVPFVENWTPAQYDYVCTCLRGTVAGGGLVLGAFSDRPAPRLLSFASVEGAPLGPAGEYRDLSSLHVSRESRGRGIGRALLRAAGAWARAQGAEKLYISSHSAVESQAFYAAMGCVDALWCSAGHMEKEPFDRQLEYVCTGQE